MSPKKIFDFFNDGFPKVTLARDYTIKRHKLIKNAELWKLQLQPPFPKLWNPRDLFTIRLAVRGEGVVKPITKLTLNLYILHN